MAIPPQPGAMPPLRPRPQSNAVLISLLVLALIFAGALAALVYGVHIISRSVSFHETHTATGNKQVRLSTPVGDINVVQRDETDPALLGLPLYPGARRSADDHPAAVNLDLPGHEAVRVLTAKFESTDSLDKVKSYYQSQLQGEISTTKVEDFGRKVVFQLKQAGEERIVSLATRGADTEISLVRVRTGPAEAN